MCQFQFLLIAWPFIHHAKMIYYRYAVFVSKQKCYDISTLQEILVVIRKYCMYLFNDNCKTTLYYVHNIFFVLFLTLVLVSISVCYDRESNTGPQDLQSCALPTELSQRILSSFWANQPKIWKVYKTTSSQKWTKYYFSDIYGHSFQTSIPL